MNEVHRLGDAPHVTGRSMPDKFIWAGRSTSMGEEPLGLPPWPACRGSRLAAALLRATREVLANWFPCWVLLSHRLRVSRVSWSFGRASAIAFA